MKQIKVTVTQNDIRYGFPNSYCQCAIALALQRTYKTQNVSVHTRTCCVNENTYNLSSKAKEFIKNFDNGKAVNPATFVFR